MKNWIVSIVAGLIVSTFAFVSGKYLSKPIYIYNLTESTIGATFQLDNIGFVPTDETHIELLFHEKVKSLPNIVNQYWTENIDHNSVMSLDKDKQKLVFNDKNTNKIEKFHPDQQLSFDVTWLKNGTRNNIKAKQINLKCYQEAFILSVTEIVKFKQALFVGAFVVIAVMMSFAFLLQTMLNNGTKHR